MPSVDGLSVEKGYKHQFNQLDSGNVQCKRCLLETPSPEFHNNMKSISSVPCVPVESGSVAKKMPFTSTWPDQLRSIMNNDKSPKEDCWQITTSSGRMFRVSRDTDDLSTFPEPDDFPLTIEAVPAEVLMQEELERLHLEELLLEEELHLVDMEAKYQVELEKEATLQRASLLNSTIPASSTLSPAASFLVALSINTCNVYTAMYMRIIVSYDMDRSVSQPFLNSLPPSSQTSPRFASKTRTSWKLCLSKGPWRRNTWNFQSWTGLWDVMFFTKKLQNIYT